MWFVIHVKPGTEAQAVGLLRESAGYGPLLGRERDIRRYSHRRRWAYLDASVAGRPTSARVGLRVTREEQRAGSRFSR